MDPLVFNIVTVFSVVHVPCAQLCDWIRCFLMLVFLLKLSCKFKCKAPGVVFSHCRHGRYTFLEFHKFCNLASGSLVVSRGRDLLRVVGAHNAQDSAVPRTEEDLRQLLMKIGIQGDARDTMLRKARLHMVVTPSRTRSTTDTIVIDDEPSVCPSSGSARSSTLCKRSPIVNNDCNHVIAKYMRFPCEAAYNAMAHDNPDKLIAEVKQRGARLKEYRVIL